MAIFTCGLMCFCGKNFVKKLPGSLYGAFTVERSIQTTSQDYFPKYHYIKKKRRLQNEKMEIMRLNYEKLDEVDRPSGCILCPHKHPDIEIDYKNVRLLSQFVSPHTGRIYGRSVTGLCELKQVEMKNAIMRARKVGLMAHTMKYFDFHTDPKLF